MLRPKSEAGAQAAGRVKSLLPQGLSRATRHCGCRRNLAACSGATQICL